MISYLHHRKHVRKCHLQILTVFFYLHLERRPFWIPHTFFNAGKMKMLLFSIFLSNLIFASFGESVEDQLKSLHQKVNQMEHLQVEVNQLQREAKHLRQKVNQMEQLEEEVNQYHQEVNQLQRAQQEANEFPQEMQEKYEAEINELKRQQALRAGIICIMFTQCLSHSNSCKYHIRQMGYRTRQVVHRSFRVEVLVRRHVLLFHISGVMQGTFMPGPCRGLFARSQKGLFCQP